MHSLKIQLWSYNYAPEPTGIGPVSALLARGLVDRGHCVDVVAAHPHYPRADWGKRRLPYREQRDGIRVLRLPLWIGRDTAHARIRQELSFVAALTSAIPLLGKPDVLISASPSFPALMPALLNQRLRRVPWILWLHDILPDGAQATGLLEPGVVINLSRQLERAAYRRAQRIVVLSRAFTDNLTAKSVPDSKIELIYDPATRSASNEAIRSRSENDDAPLQVLSMGNIGFSQGLAPLIAAYERSATPSAGAAVVRIAGTGVALSDVADEVRSSRVNILGLLGEDELEAELQAADVGLVTQRYDGGEFNIPSKLMNFMAYGLPILAAVNPNGEVARLIREADAGWVIDSSDPALLPAAVAAIAKQKDERQAKGRAARTFAERMFSARTFVDRFERLLWSQAKAPGK